MLLWFRVVSLSRNTLSVLLSLSSLEAETFHLGLKRTFSRCVGGILRVWGSTINHLGSQEILQLQTYRFAVFSKISKRKKWWSCACVGLEIVKSPGRADMNFAPME